MNKQVLPIIIAISIAVVFGIIISFQESEVSPPNGIENITEFDDTVGSGPITLLKTKYKLGENVFYHIRDVRENEFGNIVFVTPQNIIFAKIPIDGSLKTESNGYIKPDTLGVIKICTPEELIGIWNVHFENLTYDSFQFEMLDEYLPGGEVDVVKVC